MIRDTQSQGCPHLGWLTGGVGTPSRGTSCRCALINQHLIAKAAPVKGMLGRGCHGPAAMWLMHLFAILVLGEFWCAGKC